MAEILTLVFILVNSSVVADFNQLPQCQLTTHQQQKIDTRLAANDPARAKGLSHLKPDQFDTGQGLLFVYPRSAYRQFWMPDTWFDLDLFCLDSKLTITDLQRRLPHHPSRKEPIPRARMMQCRYILEMRSDSPIAKTLQPQQQLRQEGCFKS